MVPDNKALLVSLFRDNPDAIAAYLTDKFAENDLEAATTGLSQVMQAQNVRMLARDAGLRRDRLYSTFGGRIDPQISRILKLYDALNVQAAIAPAGGGMDLALQPDSAEPLTNRLTKAFVGNHAEEAILALKEVVLGQNVSALARASGIQRRTIYKTFGGKVDPHLSRVLALFAALRVRLVVVALPHKPRTSRPKLGRPPKLPAGGSRA
ncbi:transcriptional regulator [Bradyrhizobium sp. 38]|nr:transcriptional regulator [Bradyrhizobium sp. 38]MCK1777107.1 transcriptional regulator [Bradyrhizobium sp. 132]